MGLPIPIIDGLIDAGKTIIDKIWMDKADKGKLELTKEQMQQNFEITLQQLAQQGQLAKFEQQFKEWQAQRDYAHDQFGKAEALMKFGWAGKVVLLGRAGIRWAITGGSMYFTWEILNAVLTDEVINGLATNTLAGSAPYIIGLMICLVVGVPVFYVSGVSIEKIMGKRNNL